SEEERIAAIKSALKPIRSYDGRHLVLVDFSHPKTVLLKEFKALVQSMKKSSPDFGMTQNAWGPDKLKEMKHERVFEIADAMIVNQYASQWPEHLKKSDLVPLIYADQPELHNEDFKSAFRKTHMEFAMAV